MLYIFVTEFHFQAIWSKNTSHARDLYELPSLYGGILVLEQALWLIHMFSQLKLESIAKIMAPAFSWHQTIPTFRHYGHYPAVGNTWQINNAVEFTSLIWHGPYRNLATGHGFRRGIPRSSCWCFVFVGVKKSLLWLQRYVWAMFWYIKVPVIYLWNEV